LDVQKGIKYVANFLAEGYLKKDPGNCHLFASGASKQEMQYLVSVSQIYFDSILFKL